MVELLLRFADRSRACHREVRRYSVILNYNTVVKRKHFLGKRDWAALEAGLICCSELVQRMVAQRSPFDFFGFCWAILARFVREQGSVVRVVGMASVAS